MKHVLVVFACLFLVAAAQNNGRTSSGDVGIDAGPAVNITPPPVIHHYVPVYVGSNTIAQVEDIRETVGDLLAALQNARDGYGLDNAEDFDTNAKRWREELDTLEDELDLRATWIDNTQSFPEVAGTIPITISSTITQLGHMLGEMAQSLAGGDKTASLPAYVADDVVDQVDDTREAVIDFIDAVRATQNDELFPLTTAKSLALAEVRTSLENLGQHLAWKESNANEEWIAWFGGEVYKVTIHRSVSDLAKALSTIGDELSSRESAPSH